MPYIDRDTLLSDLDKGIVSYLSVYAFEEIEAIILSAPVAPTLDNKRVFEKIIVEDHNGKPYYSIQYVENGERHIGYSSYKLDYVSEWLREYFIPIINTSSIVNCKDCKYADFIDDFEVNGINMSISCRYWNTHRTAENGFCWVGEKKAEVSEND